METRQKRTTTLRSLITKWHIIRQKAVPLDHLLYAMAEDIESGIPQIPSDKIYECWMDAKSKSDFMPLDSALNEAWNRINKKVHNPNAAIEYKSKHSCGFCVIVAARLGVKVHDLTDRELQTSMLPVTREEIECVLATIGRDKTTREFWNTKQDSPYKGML